MSANSDFQGVSRPTCSLSGSVYAWLIAMTTVFFFDCITTDQDLVMQIRLAPVLKTFFVSILFYVRPNVTLVCYWERAELLALVCGV